MNIFRKSSDFPLRKTKQKMPATKVPSVADQGLLVRSIPANLPFPCLNYTLSSPSFLFSPPFIPLPSPPLGLCSFYPLLRWSMHKRGILIYLAGGRRWVLILYELSTLRVFRILTGKFMTGECRQIGRRRAVWCMYSSFGYFSTRAFVEWRFRLGVSAMTWKFSALTT